MVIILAPPFRGVSSRPHTHSLEKITLTISLTISLSSIGKVGLIFSREEGGGKVLSVKVLILPYAASNAFQFTDNCSDSKGNSLIRITSSKVQMCQLKFGKECRMDEISHQ